MAFFLSLMSTNNGRAALRLDHAIQAIRSKYPGCKVDGFAGEIYPPQKRATRSQPDTLRLTYWSIISAFLIPSRLRKSMMMNGEGFLR